MAAVITLVVVGLAVLVVVQTGSPGRAIQTVVGQTAALLPMAAALTLSLRAAAPNLAVAAISSLSGAIFAGTSADGGSAAVGILLGVGAGLLTGLVLGLVVAVLHVPAWAASLIAVLGLNAATTGLLVDGSIRLDRPLAGGGLAAVFAVFAVLSVGGGVLFAAVPALRLWFGSARPDRDPAWRSTLQGSLAVLLALTVSSGVAAVGGVVGTYRIGAATPFSTVDIGIVLVAVILGGASLYGRRAGILGTLLGTLAVTLVQLGLTLSGASLPVTLTAVALLGILGLVATRLVETFGRPDRPTLTGTGGTGPAHSGPGLPTAQLAPPAYAPVSPPRMPTG